MTAIDELRHAATHALDAWHGLGNEGLAAQFEWRTWNEYEKMGPNKTRDAHMRTYFLLVAHALEDEQ